MTESLFMAENMASYQIFGILLALGAFSVSIAVMAVPDYFTLNGAQYGIFSGKEGGSGCLGESSGDECSLNCTVNQVLAIMTSILIGIAILIILVPPLRNPKADVGVTASANFLLLFSCLFALTALMTQLFLPALDGRTPDSIMNEDGERGTGFWLSLTTLLIVGFTLIIMGLRCGGYIERLIVYNKITKNWKNPVCKKGKGKGRGKGKRR